MSQEFVIEAFPRDDQGRGASRRLRREERKIPAIIYGGNKDVTPRAPFFVKATHKRLVLLGAFPLYANHLGSHIW